MTPGGHLTPSEWLRDFLRRHLKNAVSAARAGVRVHESLRNLSEVIGGEYGEQGIFELVQNAHDAHGSSEDGEILLRLVVSSQASGELYVANRGVGFTDQNVTAICYAGISSKAIGDGIGNKGLGSRSVEALTNDPHIYSQPLAETSQRFDGFCFGLPWSRKCPGNWLLWVTPERRPMTCRRPFRGTLSRSLLRISRRRSHGSPAPATQPSSCSRSGRNERSRSPASRCGPPTEGAPLLLFLDRIGTMRVEMHEASGRSERRTLTGARMPLVLFRASRTAVWSG